MKPKVLILFFLLLTCVNLLTAQRAGKISISGFVIDTVSYRPVVGATIAIDNKPTSVRTDISGHYEVKIKPGDVTISVITENNRVKSEIIGNRTEINFPMGESAGKPVNTSTIDDSAEKVDLGISKVNKNSAIPVGKSDVLDVSGDESSMYHDIYEMIRGKVPGVDVNGQRIRIRGINSLLGNNDPLFVVDGVTVSSISDIMPNRVQSITVLKGSAAAIYGSRGTNGVLVIKMKKEGQSNK
jgi:TonB-dependent SusC/RagA subfamily outer membrane receptor